jgi:hypothetical protein
MWASLQKDRTVRTHLMVQSRLACRNISNSGAHNLTHPSEIAKAILQAVTSDNPDLWHAVGKDAIATLESRKSMSDREFQDMIKKQINI